MALPDLYSRRKRKSTISGSDVYTYDSIPKKVRVQIIHIIRGCISSTSEYLPGTSTSSEDFYEKIASTIREEKGVHKLSLNYSASDELFGWIESESDIDHLLDGFEYALWIIEKLLVEKNFRFKSATKNPSEAVPLFNARLAEAGIGYQYVSGHIVRIDSMLVHTTVVVPALHMLSDPAFSWAEAEFLDAHGAFRAGDYEVCISKCGNAFESVLKVIGARRGWVMAPTDSSAKLIAAAVSAGFLKPYLEAGFSSLRAMLQSGPPVPRNKDASHGAGATPRSIPTELAAFQLHQTAAAILFLAESDKAQA